MPHAGDNQPEQEQTHSGALSKANVINLESRVPKNKTENHPVERTQVKVSEYYNVEILKPDLLN
jgi:hypothetical protein